MVEIIKRQHAHFEGFVKIPEIEMIKYVLYGLAAVQIFLIKTLRQILLKKGPSLDIKTAVGKLTSVAVITYALCETPAIFGLILFLLNGLYTDFYILLAFSLVLMFIYFPKYTEWEEWASSNQA